MKDCTREPGRFRNRITNEEVVALQWRSWNHYPVTKFLEGEGDVCTVEFGHAGILRIYTVEGSLTVWPMDWIVKSSTGINPCTARVFDQVCEELA